MAKRKKCTYYSLFAIRLAASMTPKLMSFDVFGTLVDVREGSYGAFASILYEAGGAHIDVKAFWEHWEARNIAHYWEPYRRYRDICEMSLAETFAHFDLLGDAKLIARYFEAFPHFALYPDVAPTRDRLGRGLSLIRRPSLPLSRPPCMAGSRRGHAAWARLRPRLHGPARPRLQAGRHPVPLFARASVSSFRRRA